MTEAELAALATTGYAAVAAENGAWPVPPRVPEGIWPQECPLSILEMIQAGVSSEDLDVFGLSDLDTTVLAIVGLWTIVGEHFMGADANN